jgi:AhpD family alkylhydroperoxidase
MMLDWNGYREQLLRRIGELARTTPDTVRGYRQLADAGSKANLLGGKNRELIALAVGVTRQCDGCIAVHTEAAIQQGATREEIAEALAVAISVNAGAALVYSARVLDAFEARAGEP